MSELTVRGLMSVLKELIKERGNEVYDYKIIIGDDEELNGIHTAYFAQGLSEKDVEDFSDVDWHKELSTKSILIS